MPKDIKDLKASSGEKSKKKDIALADVRIKDCRALNIRSMRTTNSDILDVVDQGSVIKADLTDTVDEAWVRVKLPNGKKGFAMRKYLEVVK